MTTLISNAATTCGEASLHPGCCKENEQSGCHVPSGDCYCDNICHLFNDCCCDVPEVPPCDFGMINYSRLLGFNVIQSIRC